MTPQAVLEDLGVALSASDLHVLQEVFGRPEDEGVSYESFWKALMASQQSAEGKGDHSRHCVITSNSTSRHCVITSNSIGIIIFTIDIIF
jgi:hypothetical protein